MTSLALPRVQLSAQALMNLGILLVVAIYTAYPFLAGTALLNPDVYGDDAEILASLVRRAPLEPYRYYGHYLYLILPAQTYFYLTPAITMLPAVFMGTRTWFVVWVMVLLGSYGYLHHMLMGSFIPVINYMVFMPLNLWLLKRGDYRWLVVSMFCSLMWHGSSGVVIQAGTFLCMVTELDKKDWGRILLPMGVFLTLGAAGIYLLNHMREPSTVVRIMTTLGEEFPAYANYLEVIKTNSLVGNTSLGEQPPANWFFYYLGLPVFPALAIIGIAWFKKRLVYLKWLARFTILPLAVIVWWWLSGDIKQYTFDILDRASSALSIIIFMAAGLACHDLLSKR